jgi:hypothetical protein
VDFWDEFNKFFTPTWKETKERFKRGLQDL